MVALLGSLVAGSTLLAAAAMKLAEPAASRVALGTFGVGGRAAAPAWAALVAVETALGAGVLAGSRTAALAAAALLAVFAAAQLAALAAGRGGAPCGCLGARGRVSVASALRAAALGAAAAAAAGGTGLGGLAQVAVLAGGVAVAVLAAVALRRAPAEALDVTGEGPPIGAPLDLAPRGAATEGPRVLLFTASGCGLCARVRRGLRRHGAELDVTELDEEHHAAAWLAARVPGAPYAVVLDASGTVRAKGTVNTAGQVRSLVAVAPDAQAAAPPAAGATRRRLLQRAASATAAVAAADTVGLLVRPGEAEAYHFCGHIFTTDSCPHPTGLPRIDANGYPLRASDGHRVDDLGRPVDRDGFAVDEAGARLTDASGRPLPKAPRTKVCTATAREYGIRTRVDGAWYRCCKGRVRKLVDCCSTHRKRINGDRSLKGYCYADRKVFCVMFHQTKIPC